MWIIFVTFGISLSIAILLWFRISRRNYRLNARCVHAESELKLLLDKIRIVKAEDNSVSLSIATTKQIIDELKKRPNMHFLLLLPRHKKEENFVETHFINVDTDSALLLLRTAYEGVYRSMNGPPDDGDAFAE